MHSHAMTSIPIELPSIGPIKLCNCSCGMKFKPIDEKQKKCIECDEYAKKITLLQRDADLSVMASIQAYPEGFNTPTKIVTQTIPTSEDRYKECGLSQRMMSASLEDTTHEIMLRLPREVCGFLSDGAIPTQGFGLIGKSGIGKTYSILAHVLEGARNLLDRTKSFLLKDWFQIISWPEMIEEARKSEIPKDRIHGLKTCKLLLIDDLGREYLDGDYQSDRIATQLNTIVDYRYEQMLPTFWTTNLNVPELTSRYGPALLSRLFGTAPYIELPASLTDRRLLK